MNPAGALDYRFEKAKARVATARSLRSCAVIRGVAFPTPDTERRRLMIDETLGHAEHPCQVRPVQVGARDVPAAYGPAIVAITVRAPREPCTSCSGSAGSGRCSARDARRPAATRDRL